MVQMRFAIKCYWWEYRSKIYFIHGSFTGDNLWPHPFLILWDQSLCFILFADNSTVCTEVSGSSLGLDSWCLVFTLGIWVLTSQSMISFKSHNSCSQTVFQSNRNISDITQESTILLRILLLKKKNSKNYSW